MNLCPSYTLVEPKLRQVAEIQECGHLPNEPWDRDILKVLRHRKRCKTLPQGLPSLWYACRQVDGKSAAKPPSLFWRKDDYIYQFSDLDLEPLSITLLNYVWFEFCICSHDSKISWNLKTVYDYLRESTTTSTLFSNEILIQSQNRGYHTPH